MKGSVLIIGGSIAGVQAALDLADSGFYVHLVEMTSGIGGAMSQLDKTFPTNDCSACILSPKLVECGRHLNINLLTLSELEEINGEPGNFKVKVRQHPRYVDPTKCISCGECAAKCPKKVDDLFNLDMNKRKAIYLKYPQTVPLKYAIDPQHCIWLNKPGKCGACAKVCPADAINFDDTESIHELEVGAVLMSPGFRPYNPEKLDFTGYGRLKNVVTSMEFERLLSPSGPCTGHMERPSDGKEPTRVAWLQCVGSRDENRSCNSYCSSVCCMYAIKQAVIAKEHAASDLAASIYYMDMRTHGKGFEAYFERAKDQGVQFRRSRVHSITPLAEDNLQVQYADEEGTLQRDEVDLVVLSVGMEMTTKSQELAHLLDVELNENNFIKTDPFNPVATSRPGIFVCGAVSEPKDIPQSVVEASAAALEIEKMLSDSRWQETQEAQFPAERNVFAEAPKIGVFVCSCGINIAGVVDVKDVTEYSAQLPDVVFSQNNLFSCSQDTIDQMAKTIQEQGLNRVVVASCTPRTHESLFQETLRDAGLNKYLFEMANIRDQDSWVHQNDPEAATLKAKDLVRMAVARVRGANALPYNQVAVTKAALVIGGGMAGMTSALALANQGFPVTLVEKADKLGGNANRLFHTWQGIEVRQQLEKTISKVFYHDNIELKLGTTVEKATGSVGKFTTTLSDGAKLEHGTTLMAVGGKPLIPTGDHQYLYGSNKQVKTLLEVDEMLLTDINMGSIKQAVFIHCVGSRIPEQPYCSRVCCTHAIEQAVHLKKLNPEMDIFMLYRDIRTYGQREAVYKEARSLGILFIRYDLDNLPQVNEEDGQLQVLVQDHVLLRQVKFNPDLLVLATAVVAHPETKDLAKVYKCPINQEGFLLEAHMKLRPVDFATDGVYLAGLCHYPKPLEESIAQAQAAASRASLILARDMVPAESITAEVDPRKCVGCGMCTKLCPYNATTLDLDTMVASVETSLCKGCGACVAGCRSDAIILKNIANEHLMAAVDAALMEM